MKNYYETLGITEEATQEEIKKAFRELAKKWHPDRNPDNKKQAEEKFKEVSEAYDTLSNENKKAQYDHRRKFGDMPDGFNFGNYADDVDLSGFFPNAHFSNFRRRNQRLRGPDMRMLVDLTLREVVNGCSKVITFTRPVKCKNCDGTGLKGEPKTCSKCNRHGVVITEQVGHGVVFRTQTMCPHCYGSGYDISSRCKKCSDGLVEKEESIEVKVPAGITDQEMIRIQGKGGESIHESGDLYIIIRTKPDARFTRKENDLESDLKLSLKKALSGAEVSFEDINEKTILVKIPRGCQPDTVLVLQNQGIRGGRLLLKIKVDMPTLNNADIQKISEILPE